MTASKNMVLALGLTLLALAAGASSALADGCHIGGDDSCGTDGQGCGSFMGFSAEGLCHDPCCRDANNPGCFETGPLLSRLAPFFSDFNQRCAACKWRFDASAMYMHRAEPSTIALLTDPVTGGSLLSGNDLEMPYRVGERFAFVVTDCAGLGLELNYFGLDAWSTSRDFVNTDFPNGLASISVDSIITEPVTDAHVEIASMLHSSEINLRQCWIGSIDALTGFRWFDMFDRYAASGTSAVTGSTVAETIVARNHIFGWQIGLDSRIGPDDGCWAIGAYIKGGGALNNATSNISLSDPGNLGNLSTSGVLCHIAGFGEAGLTGYFQIDKHVSCSVGYQVLYINNVAQPVNQIAQTDLTAGTTQVNVGNGIFYHGANLGIDVSW
jgi:hypothetical protein